MGTQTDVHILEHNLVKDYEWNEWELRRKALKMVKFNLKLFLELILLIIFCLKKTNLRSKLTHAIQTDFSNYRRDNVTQTWQPK